MVWFWITPIFYTPDMVPQSYRWIMWVNPMTPFIMCYRDVLFEARFPSLMNMILSFVWTIASVTLGLGVFNRLQSRLLKEL